MNWLQRLLGLDFPTGAELTSVEFALRGGLRWWLVALLSIAAVLGAAWVYWREQPDMKRGRRWMFALLRGAALALLVFMIARPAIVAEAAGKRPRPVVLLVDNSASLLQVDRRTAPVDLMRVGIAKGVVSNDAKPDEQRWQSAVKDEWATITRLGMLKAVLDNSRVDLLTRLEEKAAVRTYLFGVKPRRAAGKALNKEVTADEQRTALFDSLREIATAPDGDPPAAIVILTDGADNASQVTGEDVAAELAKLDVAVHIYAVGSTDSGAVRLVDAAIPETLFLDDAANIPVRFSYRGNDKVRAVVSIALGGKQVVTKEIALAPGEGRETLSFVPTKESKLGEQTELAVSIRLKTDTTSSDEIRKPIAVSERKVRVLVIDDVPRWEFKFLQPALSRDRRVEATYLVAQGDPRALSGDPFVPQFPTRDKLFTYDLIVLGDVAPAFLGPDGIPALIDYVREGGGLAIIAGRKHMPAEYADTPLAEVLPVEFVPVQFQSNGDERTMPFQPELTVSGRRSALTNLADTPEENQQLWKELPGFFWHYPVTKLRPGAVALVTLPRKSAEEQPMPVLATQYYGKGPVMFLGADETWRWRYNSGDRLYARFWGQVVYQLGLPHLLGHATRVQLSLDRSDAVVGRPGYVYARVLDADYRPYVVEKLPAALESLDAAAGEKVKTLNLDPVPGRPGEYRALLPHDTPGRYELRVQQPETGSLPFRVVLPPGHEMEPTGLNEGPLRELAAATRGGFYREEDLQKLPNQVVAKFASFTARQEVLLWGPLALSIFVGLVSAEWVLRKLANMS